MQVNAMDAVERSCTITACTKNYNVILKVNFPVNYPYSAQPTFQFGTGTSIDNATMTKLQKVLMQTAQHRVRKNRSCLEPCLRQMISTLEQVSVLSCEINNLARALIFFFVICRRVRRTRTKVITCRITCKITGTF